MVEQTNRKIRIHGSGTAVGGVYDSVEISGSGVISGDVECGSFETNGSASIEGSLRADVMRTNGSAQIAEHVVCARVVTNGSFAAEGHISGEYMKSSGTASIRGNMSVMEIIGNGQLRVGGSCESRIFKVRGQIRIDESLQADQLEVKLLGHSEVGNISGRSIWIKKSKMDWSAIFLPNKRLSTLAVEFIEGAHIVLENTRARIVRGSHISVGSGCEIDLVEYEEHYEALPDAKVREVRRISRDQG